MRLQQLSDDAHQALEAALGYLNFSSGASDANFLASLNSLYRAIGDAESPSDDADQPTANVLGKLLVAKLAELSSSSSAFAEAAQARSVIQLTHDRLLPAYRQHHRDLLFHQSDEFLFGPFFLGRCYEAVLQCRDSADGDEALLAAALRRLNDYVGYRPVPVLENKQKLEPYGHEHCRPVPIFIRGVGAAVGRYETLVARTIDILAETDRTTLEQAYFDLSRMDELAIDPRSYDFDHPVNKRPNYQFGQWDPHQIDNKGFYRRFVVQQVTIDALLRRSETRRDVARDELNFEAAAALAGIILMASGISGYGPDTHSSDVTLNHLLQRVAAYRDAFYEDLLRKHQDNRRLVAEARDLKQPFGGVRQDLNAQLARYRASQLEHVHLARLFSRIGYPQAAARQANALPTTSARTACMIECLVTEAQFQLDEGAVESAAAHLPKIAELLHRGVECGAIVDPWSILGFDANFSVFPALENSVHDHRIDDLLELMDDIFALCARCWCSAAAANDEPAAAAVAIEFGKLAAWWDQFAVATVSSVNGFDAGPLRSAAESASAALAAWHNAGETAGDIGFWRPYAGDFESPKAYALVLDALLDRRDFVASMALLMHWLSQAEHLPLQEGSDWFHAVATQWLEDVLAADQYDPSSPAAGPATADSNTAQTAAAELNAADWSLIAKFFDYLEANADEYWEVPKLETGLFLGPAAADDKDDESMPFDDSGDEDDADEDLYAAAYEDVVYHDTTDDGIDSSLLGDGIPETDDYALDFEIKRISDRLAFLLTVARLWKRTAQALLTTAGAESGEVQAVRERLSSWLAKVLSNRDEMFELLRAVARHKIPPPVSRSYTAMAEYDRRRMVRESLLERIVASCVACGESAQFLIAAGASPAADKPLEAELIAMSDLLKAALAGDAQQVQQRLPALLEVFDNQTLLYVPLSRGGDPVRMAATRTRQRSIRLILALLPRLGLLVETIQLLETCADMEHRRPVGPGAVTEFDHLFKIAHQGLVRCIVESSATWKQVGRGKAKSEQQDHDLIEFLQLLTEVVMRRWLAHSRTLRLSVLEKIAKDKPWQRVVKFIKQYGADLFDQAFLNMGNLRTILHHGVEEWLDDAIDEMFDDTSPLPAALDDEKFRRQTIDTLQLIIEAVVENYVEYRDYNSSTTQSDRGELLFAFLDMLRVRVDYDRVAWNLTPLVLTHEVLVRQRRGGAAEIWRDEMFQRTSEMADGLAERLVALQQQYGMRLSTVADRIGERFVKPLLIDRICALVEPAMEDARQRRASTAFDELEEQLTELTAEPTGVGLDVPPWLETLEDEVERSQRTMFELEDEAALLIPQRVLTRHQAQEQLEAL